MARGCCGFLRAAAILGKKIIEIVRVREADEIVFRWIEFLARIGRRSNGGQRSCRNIGANPGGERLVKRAQPISDPCRVLADQHAISVQRGKGGALLLRGVQIIEFDIGEAQTRLRFGPLRFLYDGRLQRGFRFAPLLETDLGEAQHEVDVSPHGLAAQDFGEGGFR